MGDLISIVGHLHTETWQLKWEKERKESVQQKHSDGVVVWVKSESGWKIRD